MLENEREDWVLASNSHFGAEVGGLIAAGICFGSVAGRNRRTFARGQWNFMSVKINPFDRRKLSIKQYFTIYFIELDKLNFMSD